MRFCRTHTISIQLGLSNRHLISDRVALYLFALILLIIIWFNVWSIFFRFSCWIEGWMGMLMFVLILSFLRARIQTDIHTHTYLLLQHMRAIFRSKNVYKIKLMTKLMPIAHQTQVTRRFFFIDFISKVKQSPKVN